MGGPEFFGVVKGGLVFLSVGQRGDQNFLTAKEGGTKQFPQEVSKNSMPLHNFLLD